MLSTKGVMSLISISRLPPFFLWCSSCTAAHPSVFSGFVLLVSLDSGNVAIVAVEESQQFSDFSADSVRVPLHQS